MITWTPVTSNNTFEIEIIEKAYEHQQYLKILLFQYANRNANLLEIDVLRGIRTVSFPDLINKIEKNLDTLFGAWQPAGRKASVEWLGSILDQRWLDYTDVNRWFEMIQLLEQLIMALPQRQPITGTFRTGTNRTRQIIKRPAPQKPVWIWNYKLDGSWRLGEKPFGEWVIM